VTINEATQSIRRAAKRLQERNFRSMMQFESALMPKWSQKPARTQAKRTLRMRRNHGEPEVRFLLRILDSPDPLTAVTTYRAAHQRVLKPKKALQADSDIPSIDYQSRPLRYLTAEDLVRQQFSGKALVKELRRLR
jgi:hypothetical protein